MASTIGIVVGESYYDMAKSESKTPFMVLCSLSACPGKCIAQRVISYIRLFIDQMHACSSMPYFLPVNYSTADESGETLASLVWCTKGVSSGISFVSTLKRSLKQTFGDSVSVDTRNDSFIVLNSARSDNDTSVPLFESIDARTLRFLP